jgi:hypothetical protein
VEEGKEKKRCRDRRAYEWKEERNRKTNKQTNKQTNDEDELYSFGVLSAEFCYLCGYLDKNKKERRSQKQFGYLVFEAQQSRAICRCFALLCLAVIASGI